MGEKTIRRLVIMLLFSYVVAIGIFCYMHPTLADTAETDTKEKTVKTEELVTVTENNLNYSTYRYTNLFEVDNKQDEFKGAFTLEKPSHVKLQVYTDGITKVSPYLGNFDGIVLEGNGKTYDLSDVVADNTDFVTDEILQPGTYTVTLKRDGYTEHYSAGNLKVGIDVKEYGLQENLTEDTATDIVLGDTIYALFENQKALWYRVEVEEDGYFSLSAAQVIDSVNRVYNGQTISPYWQVYQNGELCSIEEKGYAVEKGSCYLKLIYDDGVELYDGESTLYSMIKTNYVKGREECKITDISGCTIGSTMIHAKVGTVAVRNRVTVTVSDAANGTTQYYAYVGTKGTFTVMLDKELTKDSVVTLQVDGSEYYSEEQTVKVKKKELTKPTITGYSNGVLTGSATDGTTVYVSVNGSKKKVSVKNQTYSIKVTIESGDTVKVYVTDEYGNKSATAEFKAQ